MVNKEIIKEIIGKYKGDNLAEHVHQQLNKIEQTQKKIRLLNQEIQNEDKQHEKKINKIKQKINETQKNCKHLSKMYHPDPSGNNDSFYHCNICDKYL